MTGLHEVKITADVGPGIVTVDGRDIRCRSVTLRTEPGCLPELLLSVACTPVAVGLSGAIVAVDDETSAVLVSLGWKPPERTGEYPTFEDATSLDDLERP